MIFHSEDKPSEIRVKSCVTFVSFEGYPKGIVVRLECKLIFGIKIEHETYLGLNKGIIGSLKLPVSRDAIIGT